jgi:hypothetical protein
MVSTEDGKEIDERGKRANAEDPISESREPDAKVTVEREEQLAKQSVEICSTDEGMQIDESDQHLRNTQRSMSES